MFVTGTTNYSDANSAKNEMIAPSVTIEWNKSVEILNERFLPSVFAE